MGARRPGMPQRGCARRTGFEVLNHTRPEDETAPLWGRFIFRRCSESCAEDALATQESARATHSPFSPTTFVLETALRLVFLVILFVLVVLVVSVILVFVLVIGLHEHHQFSTVLIQ